MIICPKCGKQLTDGTKFCGGCGTPVNGNTASGIQTSENTASGGQTSESTVSRLPSGGAQGGACPVQKTKKKMSKEVYLFGGIGAGAVCVLLLVMALIFFLNGSGVNAADYVFYVKEGELFFADLSDPEPWQITSRLAENGADNEELSYAVYERVVSVSGDGKTVFYPDRVNFDSGEFSLYYRSASRRKEEPVRIDTGIDDYVVNDERTLVTYIKKDVLYQYDVKKGEKTKICDMAYDISLGESVSEDGKVWYWDGEDTWYCLYQGEKEKVDSGDIFIGYISENADWVLYRKEGNLYRKEYGKDRQRIASDVYSFIAYETGEIYYMKEEDTLTLIDYVRDDMGTGVENPNVSREWLSEQKVATKHSLYYYDGEKETKILEGLLESGWSEWAYPAVAIGLRDDSGIERIKLSEIQNASAFNTAVREGLNEPERVVWYIVLKDKTTEIGDGFRVRRLLFDADGETAYFVDEEEDTGQGDLYRVEIAGDEVCKPEVFDQDVNSWYFQIDERGQVVYLKDYNYKKIREICI